MIGEASSGTLGADFDWRAALAEQQRTARRGAQAFARACRDGDAEAALIAADFLDDFTVDGWRLAMLQVGRLSSVNAEIQAAFLRIWVESKHMPLAVAHRPTMAKALHVLMPPIPLAEPLTLFRGTSALERSRRLYGFSWTTRREIAERFAEQARLSEAGAVLLETRAEPGAVHLRREDEDYYDEAEVVVDPYRLGRVRVVARYDAVREP